MSLSFVGSPTALDGRLLSSFAVAGRKLEELRQHFAQVTLVETDAFARTIRRRRAYLTETGRLKWAKFPTLPGAPIDELFAHNVSLVRTSYERNLHTVPHSRPLPCGLGRAAHRNGEAVQPRLVNEFHLTREARSVAPKPQGMVATTKS